MMDGVWARIGPAAQARPGLESAGAGRPWERQNGRLVHGLELSR